MGSTHIRLGIKTAVSDNTVDNRELVERKAGLAAEAGLRSVPA